MKKLKKIVLASTLALSSVAVHAEVITFGSLSTDSQYDVIADTEKGREYLRFDSFDMTYAETVAATSSGGAYEGWSIAGSVISDEFINGLFGQNGDNACSTGGDETGSENCGTLSGWQDGILGASGTSGATGADYYFYVGDYGDTNGKPVGLVGFGYTGGVADSAEWHKFETADSYSQAGNGLPINFLLYRENSLHIGGFNTNAAANNLVSNSTSVPLPTTLGLLGLAMAGLSFRRKLA